MTEIGTMIDGKYEILKQIGQGGMSVVYLAMDNRLHKSWAIKEIRKREDGKNDTVIQGLLAEANMLKRFDHPTLPRIVDIIDKDGSIYVVMDYIEGRDLDDVLLEEGAQDQEKVIKWAKQLSEALSYLHTRTPPIIYRDMKPKNIMLQPDGRITLIDFGTAREYKQENIKDTVNLGTRGYAAPEQFQGANMGQTDARTDVYCLGATLYHLLTGKNPSEPPYKMVPIREINPNLSSGLEAIINKCIQPNPDDRFQSCAELLYALDHYHEMDDEYRSKQRRKLMVFAASVVIMASFILTGFMGKQGIETVRLQDYQNLIERAMSHTQRGNYAEAADQYIAAITEVDGSNSEAYIRLIDLYINYLPQDEETRVSPTREGLNRVENFVNSGHGGVDQNNDVLFKIALTYFSEERDYRSALRYFTRIDESEIEEVRYYRELSSALGELNLDYNELADDLIDFTNYNHQLRNDENKVVNYLSLLTIYNSHIDQIEGGNTKAIEVGEKALEVLESLTDYSMRGIYELQVIKHLANAYHHRGMEHDMGSGEQKDDLRFALFYNESVLQMIDYEESRSLAVRTYNEMAGIHEQLGEIQKAENLYQDGIQEFGQEAMLLHISYLAMAINQEYEKTSDVTEWNRQRILGIYNNGMKVNGIESDVRWIRLSQRIRPIL